MSAGYWGSDRVDRLTRERIQDNWKESYSPLRHLDPVLIVATLLLTAVGVMMVYSATYQRLELAGQPTTELAVQQLVHWGAAVVALVVVAAVDYRHLKTWAGLIFAGGVVLLGLVLTPMGLASAGAQRWVSIAGFQLQPSELAKVALVVVLAAVLHERKGDPGVGWIGVVVALALLPTGLVLAQPDIGTAAVFPWIAFVLLVVGGARARYLAGLAVAGVLAPIAALRAGLFELQAYQWARLSTFLDPSDAELAQTTAYNAQQSMIAIGSGGFGGKGFLQGTQTHLAYVPENHTDFIFTVVGEEFGFLGAALVLGLFAVVIWRGLRIAALSKDLFGTLLAVGAVAVLVFQVFINVGMTVGVAPVTGIPLPFVSYGGTSLLAGYLLVGILLNVHMRRF